MILAEHDDLRASGESFADAARAAGVEISEYLALGVPHGHLATPADVPETARTLRSIAGYVGGR